jgi:hypothetical protein
MTPDEAPSQSSGELLGQETQPVPVRPEPCCQLLQAPPPNPLSRPPEVSTMSQGCRTLVRIISVAAAAITIIYAILGFNLAKWSGLMSYYMWCENEVVSIASPMHPDVVGTVADS